MASLGLEGNFMPESRSLLSNLFYVALNFCIYSVIISFVIFIITCEGSFIDLIVSFFYI